MGNRIPQFSVSWEEFIDNLIEKNKELEEENKKLNEFKEKREKSMFYFKAQMERAEPKTAREAEDLQRAKEIFEKLYREELSCLEEENGKLKIHIEAKDKAYMDLLTDYNYLKARIKKMEKAYLNFHDDLKRLDDKLDNDIMNR